MDDQGAFDFATAESLWLDSVRGRVAALEVDLGAARAALARKVQSRVRCERRELVGDRIRVSRESGWLTVDEAAGVLDVTRRRVQQLARQSDEVVRLGGIWLIPPSAVEGWMEVRRRRGQYGRPLPSPTGSKGRDGSIVYYLLFGGLVKIGTSSNLGQRLRDLPHDDLLAVECGGFDVEAARHQQFAEYRHRGEWFRLEGRLRDHVATLASRGDIS